MEQINKIMKLSFFGFMFSIALSFLFRGNESMKKLQSQICQKINNEIAVESHREESEILSTKADIIAVLITKEIEYDIEVNGTEIKKIDHNPIYFNGSIVSDGQYQKKYIYNSKGKLIKIIFTKVS